MEMVKSHYADLNEKEFVAAIASWVKKPDAKKSRMPGAVNRFGMMPPLPYPDKELEAIAGYLFQTKFEGSACVDVGKETESLGKSAAKAGSCRGACRRW